MQRITISLDDDLFGQLDALIIAKGYDNRSEIFRDFIREDLRKKGLDSETGYCTAVVSYSYDHGEVGIPEKIFSLQEDLDAVVISTMQVHTSKEECVGSVILHGKIPDVRKIGEATIATKGIRNGHVHLIPDPIKRRLYP